MESYIKYVDPIELQFNLITNINNISPKVLGVDKVGFNEFKMESEQYQYTLKEFAAIYANDSNVMLTIVDKIHSLIDKLYEQGIFHGDLHYENVVVNPDLEVRIIDYGLSLFHQDILTGRSRNFMGYQAYLEIINDYLDDHNISPTTIIKKEHFPIIRELEKEYFETFVRYHR
ncbi:Protein kinase domain protein [compost metagenome]